MRRDGTGPMGEGSMTGRKMGVCSGNAAEEQCNNPGLGLGRGRGCGKGLGRSGRGFGCGNGRGFRGKNQSTQNSQAESDDKKETTQA